jgi:hypothetical protein
MSLGHNPISSISVSALPVPSVVISAADDLEFIVAAYQVGYVAQMLGEQRTKRLVIAAELTVVPT